MSCQCVVLAAIVADGCCTTDLVYEGFKVMPYSTACHTPLSNFETGPDCYKEVQDPAIVVTFPLLDEPEVSLLAWTTTPWTLPSNFALCVNEKMVYVKIRDAKTKKVYVLAKERLEQLYKPKKKKDDNKEKEYEILEEFGGKSLVGRPFCSCLLGFARR